MDENQIKRHMKILGISREEAIQLIEDDRRIDKGEKLFELTPEQKQAAKRQDRQTASLQVTSLTLPKGKDLQMKASGYSLKL